MRKKLIKKGQYGLNGLYNNYNSFNNILNSQQQLFNTSMNNLIPTPKLSETEFKFDPITGYKKASINQNYLSNNSINKSSDINLDKLSSNTKSISSASDLLSNILPNANNNIGSNSINKGTDFISDTLMNIPDPTGTTKIIGAAMKVNSALNKGVSAITNGATTIKNASNIGDNILSSDLLGLTPIGLANSLTKKKISGTNSALADSAMNGGYGQTDTIAKTEIGGVSNFFNKLFGGKDLVSSRKKDVAAINKTNALKTSNIQSNTQKVAASNQAIYNTGMRNQIANNGGINYSFLTAKKGATLEDIRNYIKVRNIKKEVPQNPNLEQNINNFENIEIEKFQNGGSVIPSGALHKNKHNLEEINPDLNGEITKKGIPVISIEEGGEVIQHAEIEKEEVILNLSLTKKLLELMRKNDIESQIEAGKLLSYELMENTTDNSGITDKILNNEN